ncbi:uncharacterized protein LOC144640830 [Oculina patagonica]
MSAKIQFWKGNKLHLISFYSWPTFQAEEDVRVRGITFFYLQAGKCNKLERFTPLSLKFDLVIVSGAAVIGFLQNTYNRAAFSCVSEPDAFTKQLCYDKYSSTLNYFVVITYAVLFVCWIFFAVYGAVTVRQIKRDRQNQSKQSLKFKRVYIIHDHVCFRLIFIGVMIVLFCSSQTLSVPSMYKCSLATNTTRIPSNQTEIDLFCHDQHYKRKSNLNFAIIAVKAFIMVLCIIEFGDIILPPPGELLNKLLGEVVGDSESRSQGRSIPSP